MSDRIDPSQYPAAYDFRELAYPDRSDGIDGQPEDPAFTEGSTDKALTNYPAHHDLIPDFAAQYPAIVQTVAPVKQEIRPRPLGVGAMVTGRGLFAGFALRETTGAAAAVVRFRDGLDASGPIIFPVALAQGTSASTTLNPRAALRFINGLYVELVSGSVEGAVLTVRDYRD